jgi:hypothetical protein
VRFHCKKKRKKWKIGLFSCFDDHEKKAKQKKRMLDWEIFKSINVVSVCLMLIVFLLIVILSLVLEQPAHNKHKKLYLDMKNLHVETTTAWVHCLHLKHNLQRVPSSLALAFLDFKSKMDQWKVYERLYSLEEIGTILSLVDFVTLQQQRQIFLQELYKLMNQRDPQCFLMDLKSV